jgi:hypothetical protein
MHFAFAFLSLPYSTHAQHNCEKQRRQLVLRQQVLAARQQLLAALDPGSSTRTCCVHWPRPLSLLDWKTYVPAGYSCPSTCGVTIRFFVVNMPLCATGLSGWARRHGPWAGCRW